MKFANIIVDISLEKLDRTFQYRVPEELQGILKEGMQVRIPFGNGGRTLTGYVLELTDTCEWDEKKLKPILGLAEKGIRLEGQLIALAAWMRRTYGSTMNQALKTVLPVKKSVQEKISRKVRLAVTKEEAEAALAEMVRQQGTPVFDDAGMMKRGVIVRHLVLPGQAEDSKAVIRYLFETYGRRIYLSIMSQFTPTGDLSSWPELNRTLTPEEYDQVVDYAVDLGVENGFTQEGAAADESFIPPFGCEGV